MEGDLGLVCKIKKITLKIKKRERGCEHWFRHHCLKLLLLNLNRFLN